MNAPAVSVIIPVFNVREYLPRVVESLKSQSASTDSWEAVFVDDCSPDGSLDLLKILTDGHKNMRVISRESNGGLSAARNTGIEASDGRYIAQLDGDDMLLPHSVDMLLRRMKENPSMEYFYSSHTRINEEGVIIGERKSEPYVPKNLLHYNFVGHLKGYSRELNDAIGGFRDVYAEDWDHIIRASEVISDREVCQIPESLYLYTIRDGSIVTSTSRAKKVKDLSTFLVPHIKKSVGSPVELFFSHTTPEKYAYYDWREVKDVE